MNIFKKDKKQNQTDENGNVIKFEKEKGKTGQVVKKALMGLGLMCVGIVTFIGVGAALTLAEDDNNSEESCTDIDMNTTDNKSVSSDVSSEESNVSTETQN